MSEPDRDASGPIPDDSTVEDDRLIEEGLRELRPLIEMLDRAGKRMGEAVERSSGPGPGPGPMGSLGDFRIVRVVGRGGMGVVYEAVQESLQRRVALKLLPPIFADDPRRVRRFQVEAQAAACLQHPHIIPVYLVGSEAGQHYFVMQFIEGRTLAEVIAASRTGGDSLGDLTSPRRTAELGRQAALALHFAHEQGITHRDVKPSNLMVDDSGWLWVGDFGLARIAGQADVTHSGALVGTLRYMSPEQASGARVGVDHRSDVYSLGATLYELLTGHAAFYGYDHLDLLGRIVGEEPKAPRRLKPAIPKDLETIVLKAMAKDPAERYATALELADDLDRFLDGRPILARTPGPIDRAAKWARRHRKPVMAVVIASVAALAGAASWRDGLLRRHNRELEAALGLAERNEATTRRLLYDSQVRMAQQTLDAGNAVLGREILEGLRPAPGRPDLRGFEWSYLLRACDRGLAIFSVKEPLATAAALAPNGKVFVTGHSDGTLIARDLADGRKPVRHLAHSVGVDGLAFSPDGRFLVSWPLSGEKPSEVQLWDATDFRWLARLPRVEGRVINAAFSLDGSRLYLLEHALVHGGSWSRVMSWDLARGPEHLKPVDKPIDAARMASSLDGRWLATSQTTGAVDVRDAATGEVKRTLPGPFPWIAELACSPDGQILAVAGRERLVFWDLATSRELGSVAGRLFGPPSFSPDGSSLAGRADTRQTILLVADVRTKPRLVPLEATSRAEIHFAFSPDGSKLAATGSGLPATVFETASGRKLAELPGMGGRVGSLGFTSEGERLIVPFEDGPIYDWRFDRPVEPSAPLDAHGKNEVWSLVCSRDGTTLVSAGDDHRVNLWDPRDGRLRTTLEGHESLVAAVAVSRDRDLLASASFDQTVRLWSLPDGRPVRVLRGATDKLRAVAISRDGRRVAASGSDPTVHLWDTGRDEPILSIPGHRNYVRALVFDPTGGMLFSASEDGTIRGIDVERGREVFAMTDPYRYSCLALSPDGSLLASGEDGGSIILWDLASRTRRMTVRATGAMVLGLAFSPDGRTLATACSDARVRLWDPATGQLLVVLEGHSRRVNAVAFSPDGRSLSSASHDGQVRVWRAESP